MFFRFPPDPVDVTLVTDLATSVESLKRAVALGGTFAALYPSTLDTDLTATLADGFAEAQLDGWFPNYTLSTTVSPVTATVGPDITQAEARLVIIYAACQMVHAQLLNLKNRKDFQAGQAKVQTEQSVSLLTGILNAWITRRDDLVERAQATSIGNAFAVADMYFARAVGTNDAAYYDTSFVFGYDDPLLNDYWL